MHFLSPSECRDWCGSRRIPFDAHGTPLPPNRERFYVRAPIPRDFTQLLPFCRTFEGLLQPRRACLLWITEFDIWDSNTNWHLYYRLRQSYGDQRQLYHAPGHLFLNDEAPDMVSFVQLAALFGFDAHLIPDVTGYGRAFVSHDEFVEFAANEANPELVTEFAATVGGSVITGPLPPLN